MKRSICLLLILCSIFLLFSCAQKGPDDLDEDQLVLSFDDVFEMSKNVYIATLEEYEKKAEFEYRLVFKVESVFKGEYYQNDIVEDTLSSHTRCYEKYAKFIVGERYLYMSGVDPEYSGNKKTEMDFLEEREPLFKLIRIGDYGEIYQAGDFYTDKRYFGSSYYPKYYADLVNRLLYYPLRYMYDYYKDMGKNLLEVYDESTNVYIAKVISYKMNVDNDSESKPLYTYKAELEVKSVIKGDIDPKSIVEDNIIYFYLGGEWNKNYDNNFFVLVMSNDTVPAENSQPTT